MVVCVCVLFFFFFAAVLFSLTHVYLFPPPPLIFLFAAAAVAVAVAVAASLGFHLAIEQLVQAVRQRRSLFGCVVDSLEDAFRAMDSSGRGSLEESDLARALKRLDIEMSPGQLRELLEHLDANGDGVVDAGEFLEAMRRHEEQMNPSPMKAPSSARDVSPQRISSSGTDNMGRVKGVSPIRQPRMSRGGEGNMYVSPRRQQQLRLGGIGSAGSGGGGGGGGDLLSPVARGSASSQGSGGDGKPKWRR